MVCPVQGAVAYADTWGAARSGGRSHQGVDMMAPSGTPLVAVVSGSVNFKQTRLGGNSIWLSGNDGNRYFYAHLSSFEGSSRSVSQGEVIGYVGSTGNALHAAPPFRGPSRRRRGGQPVPVRARRLLTGDRRRRQLRVDLGEHRAGVVDDGRDLFRAEPLAERRHAAAAVRDDRDLILRIGEVGDDTAAGEARPDPARTVAAVAAGAALPEDRRPVDAAAAATTSGWTAGGGVGSLVNSSTTNTTTAAATSPSTMLATRRRFTVRCRSCGRTTASS